MYLEYRLRPTIDTDNMKKTSGNMKEKLDNVNTGFNIFKKMATFVKENFAPSLQTILLLLLIATMVFGFYYGSKWVEKLLLNYPAGLYTVEETKESFERDRVINAILSDTIIDYKADRSKLIQFHNGTHSLGGVPFRYLSITHERVDTGISSEILNYQQIPTSVMGAYVEPLMNRQLVIIRDVEAITEASFKQLMSQQGTTAKCMYPIFDNAGRFTAYITLDYVGRTVPVNENGVCICDTLVREAHTIENILFGE